MGAMEGIGNTPLVERERIRPSRGARIGAKIERADPTGSMEDRMARTAMQAAARDGRLPAGGKFVECTVGSTGISLAAAVSADDGIATARRRAREEGLFASAARRSSTARPE